MFISNDEVDEGLEDEVVMVDPIVVVADELTGEGWGSVCVEEVSVVEDVLTELFFILSL